jgi:biotin carboxylase
LKRLLILSSKLGYQTRNFAEAATRLGADVIFGTDRCGRLEDPWADGAVPLHFENPEQAGKLLASTVRDHRVDALLALGDRPTATAAHAAAALGITYNSPQSVENCRTKLRQREVLQTAGLPVPEFFAFSLREDFSRVLPHAKFPCVVKPLALAGSQGVIRANNPSEFMIAASRVRALLESPELRATREPSLDRLLVERYISGDEVAVEALLTGGELRVLAIFDKPGHPEGPYFEESIYVTPSQQPALAQASIAALLRTAARALGLTHGPVHAEFRLNEDGPWVLEIQPRPIGGLCSRALRFGPEKIFLEEMLVRHALGMDGSDLPRETDASGVMMIPVPLSGVLENVEGESAAEAVPGITEVLITARLHDYIAAWPEGSSYLGFIFARGAKPAEVVAALKQAHAKLEFTLSQRLPVEHPLAHRPGGEA